jgi:hypothetical protein
MYFSNYKFSNTHKKEYIGYQFHFIKKIMKFEIIINKIKKHINVIGEN